MPEDRPDVVFIILDTARASAFQLRNGGGATSTPAFADLASRGRRFAHAIAPAPWTLPSHVSFFSGLMPSAHGLMGDAWEAGSLPNVAPLIERVGATWLPLAAKAAGYSTFAAVANGWVGPRTGFDAGFDTFHGLLSDGTTSLGTKLGRRVRAKVAPGDNGGPHLVSLFERWLRGRHERGTHSARRTAPTFAFLNLLEPHAPYDPPGIAKMFSPAELERARSLIGRLHRPADLMIPFNLGQEGLSDTDSEILRRLYEAEVSVADAAVERLLHALDRNGTLDSTAVIVGSDHGENVGEHHLLAHNMSMHETLLHVPLVMAGPGIEAGTEARTVSALNIHPTLLEFFDGARRPGSLLSEPTAQVLAEYEGAVHQVRALPAALAAEGSGQHRVPALATHSGVAAYRGQFKAIATGERVHVFDLANDPDEATPLAASSDPDAKGAAILAKEHLARFVARTDVALDAQEISAEMDEEIRLHLEGLGYL